MQYAKIISVLGMLVLGVQAAPIEERQVQPVTAAVAPASHGPFTGWMTYYTPGMGSCGIPNGPGERVAAVDASVFDAWMGGVTGPNKNPICGKTAKITRDGKSVTAKIVDRCIGCVGGNIDLDLSVFSELGLETEGKISGISWEIVDA